jgi:hypothetical protein
LQRCEHLIRFACIAQGSFEDVEEILGCFMTHAILVDRSSGYACPVHSRRVVEVKACTRIHGYNRND